MNKLTQDQDFQVISKILNLQNYYYNLIIVIKMMKIKEQ